MFCQECGQLIQKTRGTIKRPELYTHVNPINNDHTAVFDPGNIPPTREQMGITK